MAEEMKRREAELNEAALEGVSGGEYDPIGKAIRICDACAVYTQRVGRCDGSQYAVLKYLHLNGIDSIDNYTQCPYYRR